MAQVHIHRGPYTAIPETASPGLLFLRNLLPALDSLGPFDSSSSSSPSSSSSASTLGHQEPQPQPQPASLLLIRHLAPGATFVMNGGPPLPAVDVVLRVLPQRGQSLSRFHHDVRIAWDIAANDGSGRRTVLYESTALSTFKADPDALEVRVAEFNVIELVPCSDSDAHASAGAGTGTGTGQKATSLKALQLRTFLDGAPVTSRAQMISAK